MKLSLAIGMCKSLLFKSCFDLYAFLLIHQLIAPVFFVFVCEQTAILLSAGPPVIEATTHQDRDYCHHKLHSGSGDVCTEDVDKCKDYLRSRGDQWWQKNCVPSEADCNYEVSHSTEQAAKQLCGFATFRMFCKNLPWWDPLCGPDKKSWTAIKAIMAPVMAPTDAPATPVSAPVSAPLTDLTDIKRTPTDWAITYDINQPPPPKEKLDRECKLIFGPKSTPLVSNRAIE